MEIIVCHTVNAFWAISAAGHESPVSSGTPHTLSVSSYWAQTDMDEGSFYKQTITNSRAVWNHSKLYFLLKMYFVSTEDPIPKPLKFLSVVMSSNRTNDMQTNFFFLQIFLTSRAKWANKHRVIIKISGLDLLVWTPDSAGGKRSFMRQKEQRGEYAVGLVWLCPLHKVNTKIKYCTMQLTIA